jgi:N-acetylglucosaminyl-diphospho-decaprenol L-rhamnosyltransferase
MPELAVLIVNWNTRDLTLEALRTLYDDIDNHGPPDTRVWVVDNASRDDSVTAIRRAFPRVQLLESKTNLGFGGGNNLALRAMGFGVATVTVDALPRAVYLLNSDTLTHSGTTNTLYSALMAKPDAGVVGARLTYEDGQFQHSAFAFPGLMQLAIDLFPTFERLYDTPLNGRYPRYLYQQPQPFRVGFVLGATMMLRREAIQRTGLFDEQLFMYAEEVDWCWRIRKTGWQIYCVPGAHVTHLEGQSTRQVKPQSILNLWRSRVYLYRKHYSWPKRALARGLVRFGMRFQIQRARYMYQQKQLSRDERDALVNVYQQVAQL